MLISPTLSLVVIPTGVPATMSTPEVFIAEITTVPNGSDTTGLVVGLMILALIFATSVVVISCVGVVMVKRRKKDVGVISNPNYEQTDTGKKNSFTDLSNPNYDYTGGNINSINTRIMVEHRSSKANMKGKKVKEKKERNKVPRSQDFCFYSSSHYHSATA